MNQDNLVLAKKIKNESSDQSILISIITIVRNSESILESTILSVLNQDYLNVEYIIIDGLSNDNTVDIIKKYENKIDYWISEPDNGIYDAMNKGIELANGEWINFMNAGDEFIDHNICSLIAEQILIKRCDLIYGDFIARDVINNSEILVPAKPLKDIWKGMVFCHQSTFIRLSTLKRNHFDLKYKIAADFNQILSLYIKNNNFCYIPNVISKVSIGGVSYSNLFAVIEQIKIIYSYKPYSIYILYFIKPFILGCFRSIIGAKGVSIIRKYKWKFNF
jgi:glycosyltransferase involved in cell wall biosynthesis